MISGLNAKKEAVFNLTSIGYAPNVSVMGGLNVPESALGITIDVCGQMKVNAASDGVRGVVGFRTRGKLTGPLSMLPESVLRSAAEAVNKKVIDFALESFKTGSEREYAAFVAGYDD